jgi:cyclopropane-fatty-acyl-phospholipid synthase
MGSTAAKAMNWVEQGLVPDKVIRLGIGRLLKERLVEIHSGDPDAAADLHAAFIDEMRAAPMAPLPEKANEQHYEVPAAFFAEVLGPHRKYSSCFWGPETITLEQAEAAALEITCARAGLVNGQDVLELGCGWGSLTLWMAGRYPGSHNTAVSNSASQREYIEAEAARRGYSNVTVLTRDINDFDIEDRFDRIVSVEMFEHLRNWQEAFRRVSTWLKPGGRFFMHVFVQRTTPYAFVDRDESDWMSRQFFSGGMMPSDDLPAHFQDDLKLLRRWRWDGTHYQRTSQAWLSNMDARRAAIKPVLEQAYGADADLWRQRWRLFFMAVAELFGHDNGREWWVSHYLFEKRGERRA